MPRYQTLHNPVSIGLRAVQLRCQCLLVDEAIRPDSAHRTPESRHVTKLLTFLIYLERFAEDTEPADVVNYDTRRIEVQMPVAAGVLSCLATLTLHLCIVRFLKIS